MALSEKCEDRLHNWKFEQAQEYLGDAEPTDRERELVDALAAVFGDSGWLDGELGVIVSAAVGTLIPDEQEGGG